MAFFSSAGVPSQRSGVKARLPCCKRRTVVGLARGWGGNALPERKEQHAVMWNNAINTIADRRAERGDRREGAGAWRGRGLWRQADLIGNAPKTGKPRPSVPFLFASLRLAIHSSVHRHHFQVRMRPTRTAYVEAYVHVTSLPAPVAHPHASLVEGEVTKGRGRTLLALFRDHQMEQCKRGCFFDCFLIVF